VQVQVHLLLVLLEGNLALEFWSEPELALELTAWIEAAA
jgi:hypothetical protein